MSWFLASIKQKSTKHLFRILYILNANFSDKLGKLVQIISISITRDTMVHLLISTNPLLHQFFLLILLKEIKRFSFSRKKNDRTSWKNTRWIFCCFLVINKYSGIYQIAWTFLVSSWDCTDLIDITDDHIL